MNITVNLFQQAEFSLAAYSNLYAGISGESYKNALVAGGTGMSSIQATRFADAYAVLAQYNDTTAEGGSNSGLSVTVFQNKETGEKYLAIRGTNDLDDLLSDIVDIALLGTNKLQAQYTRLKAKVTEWIGDGTLSSSFSISGHSLGGFLATGLTADFANNVSHTYLYNAPGVGGVVGSILSALGVAATTIDATKVSNIKAEAGPNIIAGLGTQVSIPLPVEIEDQTASGITNRPAALNHSQQVLTDALAVQSVFARLDPSLSQAQLNTLIDASGTNANDILESALDGLRKLILGPSTASTSTDRNATGGNDLYTHLYALQESTAYTNLSSAGTASVISLADGSATAFIQKASQTDAEGLAYRYALTELNPFAVLGADYTAHGALDRYDPVTGTGQHADMRTGSGKPRQGIAVDTAHQGDFKQRDERAGFSLADNQAAWAIAA